MGHLEIRAVLILIADHHLPVEKAQVLFMVSAYQDVDINKSNLKMHFVPI
jgi:hypothetical protein